MARQTSPIHRFDYVYWSSPLTLNSDYLLGKDPANLDRIGLSPDTYFNKFHAYNEDQTWRNINYGNEVMVPGKGYIIRAPQTADYGQNAASPDSYREYTANFLGTPNNGIVRVPLHSNGRYTLIGNPYPSAISAEEFILDPENIEKFDGAIYIWKHTSAPTAGTNGFYYTANDYATFNLTGAVGLSGNYQIPAGQSFMVKSTSNNSQIIFKNAHRIKNNNTHFYRPGIVEVNENAKHRFWLNLSTNNSVKNQILIGYIPNATNDVDYGYDAVLNTSAISKIYAIVNNAQLAIQGRSVPFNHEDVVTLGLVTATPGTYTLQIESFDGLFSTQNIYLKDNYTNLTHNIKDEAYTFTSAAGTYNDRFEIVYVTQTLSTDNPQNKLEDVVIYKNNQQIVVKAASENISEISVYDLQGKLLYHNNQINNQQYTTQNLQVQQQVVLVKIVTESSATKTQKIVME